MGQCVLLRLGADITLKQVLMSQLVYGIILKRHGLVLPRSSICRDTRLTDAAYKATIHINPQKRGYEENGQM